MLALTVRQFCVDGDVRKFTVASWRSQSLGVLPQLRCRGKRGPDEALPCRGSLTQVDDALILKNNATLTTLDGLSGLSLIHRDLEISGHATLTTLAGLAGLDRLGGDLRVLSNGELSSLGLSASTAFDGALFQIESNPLLPATEATSLAQSWCRGACSALISGNGS